MTNRFHGRMSAFAVVLVAAVASTAFAATYARAGGLQAAEQFVQPFLKTFSGNSTGPIVVTHNKGTGPSLQGTSDKGNGIVGQTKLNNGGLTGATALVGQDLGTSGAQANAGVGGTSVEGTGVYGTSASGAGIFGSSSSSVGMNGVSSSSYGVVGASNSGTGVSGSGTVGLSGAGSAQSIVAFGQGGELYRGVSSGLKDVYDVSDDGSVVSSGQITGGADLNHQRGVEGDSPVFGVVGVDSGSFQGSGVASQSFTGDVYEGSNLNSQVFRVTNSGDVYISGLLYSAGICSSGCAKPGKEGGRHVISYIPAESEPTTEDFGEGHLRDGTAHVQIAPDFANTIDRNATYMVFLSPEGDNHGLYVTDKTTVGFAVRESQGGHSTLAFGYRIVAKRYGVAQQRLPMINVPAAPHFMAGDLHKPSSLGRLVPRPAKIPRPIIHQ
jgi:hypothetical protein